MHNKVHTQSALLVFWLLLLWSLTEHLLVIIMIPSGPPAVGGGIYVVSVPENPGHAAVTSDHPPSVGPAI